MEILLVTALAFAFLYFMVLRPQAKKLREQQEMQGALVAGDRVVLTSGIFGTIRHMGDKQAVVELAPGVTLTVLRGALLRKVADAEEEFEYDDEPLDDDGAAIAAPLTATAAGATVAPWAGDPRVAADAPLATTVEAGNSADPEDAPVDVAWPAMSTDPASDAQQNRKEY